MYVIGAPVALAGSSISASISPLVPYFELPEIDQLSEAIGTLLAEAGYQNHWVWQCRSTTIDLLWPRA
jgi:hypothetical protein